MTTYTVIELIKEWLELAAKQNWLNHINRAIDKYNKLNQKARVQAHVIHKLVERYDEIYHGNKIKLMQKDGQNGYQKTDQQAH